MVLRLGYGGNALLAEVPGVAHRVGIARDEAGSAGKCSS
jgi:hypothetical protein